MASSTDVETVLQSSFLFSRLAPEDLQQLLAISVVRKFAREQVIFTKRDPSDGLYAVVRGKVRIVSHSNTGNEIAIRLVDSGEVFGEIGILDEQARTATAIANEAAELLVLQREPFVRLLERDPGLSLKLLAGMASRLRTTTSLLEDTLFLNVSARLAKKLLELAEAYGKPVPDGIRIELRLTQELLGSFVGTSRVSVSQQLRAWRDRELVDVQSSYITLRQMKELERIAGGGESEV